MLESVRYWEENISEQIKTPYLLMVLLLIPLIKLPQPESSNAQPQNELATSFYHSKLGL